MGINTILQEFYKGKTVLLTGATGFKGSWLAFWLTEMGAKVIGYSLPPLTGEDHFNLLHLNDKITHIEADILDLKKLQEVFDAHQPEIVFHLAAQVEVGVGLVNPFLTFETNVSKTMNIGYKDRPTLNYNELFTSYILP